MLIFLLLSFSSDNVSDPYTTCVYLMVKKTLSLSRCEAQSVRVRQCRRETDGLMFGEISKFLLLVVTRGRRLGLLEVRGKELRVLSGLMTAGWVGCLAEVLRRGRRCCAVWCMAGNV